MFAYEGVDQGTRTLLLEAPPPAPDATELLDLGCGYSPIALTLALRAPGARVWAVDVNERALALSRSNAEEAGFSNVVVCTPEEVPPTVRFDGIWSNPPVRIGKRALHELLRTWLPRLSPGASAWLVVQRNLGSDSLAAWLGGAGWTVRRHVSRRGFRVLEVSGGQPRLD